MFSAAEIRLDLLPAFIQGMEDYVRQLKSIHDSTESDDVRLDRLETFLGKEGVL